MSKMEIWTSDIFSSFVLRRWTNVIFFIIHPQIYKNNTLRILNLMTNEMANYSTQVCFSPGLLYETFWNNIPYIIISIHTLLSSEQKNVCLSYYN